MSAAAGENWKTVREDKLENAILDEIWCFEKNYLRARPSTPEDIVWSRQMNEWVHGMLDYLRGAPNARRPIRPTAEGIRRSLATDEVRSAQVAVEALKTTDATEIELSAEELSRWR